MNKIKLLEIEKFSHHNHYKFPKKQEVFTIIRALLKQIGLKKYEWDAFGRPTDKEYGEPLFNQEIDIKDYTDRRFAFGNEEYFIEIVFGKNKVFLMIHTKTDKQKYISKILSNFIRD